MDETEETQEDVPKKASKLPLILAVVVALAGGAGAFFFMYTSGESGSEDVAEEVAEEEALSPLADVAFVPLPPMVIALGDSTANRLLRFQAQLEVARGDEETVSLLEPRIMDVLNTYLRAVSVDDLESRRALIRLRAQMLRRIQIVTGGDHVRDLLITEFVLT
jgi:flagellar FliL protein